MQKFTIEIVLLFEIDRRIVSLQIQIHRFRQRSLKIRGMDRSPDLLPLTCH